MWRRLLKAAREAPPRDEGERRRLATAVLLTEIARADFEHAAPESEAIERELAGALHLAPGALAPLLGEAHRAARESVSLHDFVATLNAELDADGKRELMAMLWRVAWADGRIDPHEEHLIRRLAGLLHVPHAEFVRQKHRAGP